MTSANDNADEPLLDNVELMPPGEAMSPGQALAAAARRPLKDVLIIGVHEDGDWVIMSSKMSREWALWMAEHAKLHALGML